jgi:hypothetical protein
MYFVGAGIFALVSILCIWAFVVQRRRQKHYWDDKL